MKTTLTVAAVLALTLTMATPALADPHGRYRGQKRHCHVTGGVAYAAPVYFAAPRVRGGFYFGFSGPGFYGAIGAPGFYAAVGAPVSYAPAPVVVAQPVWVPGHWTYDNGARFYAEGHWRR